MRNSYALKASVISAIACVASAVITAGAYADGKQDYYIQQAERNFAASPLDAVSAGVSGADIYTERNSSAALSNPAGLGFMKDGDTMFTYGTNEQSGNEIVKYTRIRNREDYGQVTGSVPLSPMLDAPAEFGSLAMGWSGTWDDSNNDANTEGDTQQVNIGYGIALNDDISLGYGLVYSNVGLKNDNGRWGYDIDNGFKHIFGAQYNVSDDLVLGASYAFGLSDADTYVNRQKIDDSSLLSSTIAVGADYKLSNETKLNFAIDYTSLDADGSLTNVNANPRADFISGGNEGGDVTNYRIGVTQQINDMFTVRGGYRFIERTYFFGREDLRDLNGSAKTGAYNLGVGVNIPTGMHYAPNVKLDYAAEYRDIAYGDWLQAVTVSVPFTLCAPM